MAKGEIESANRMFGFPYRVDGQVVQGNKLGRSIGFPTLNLPWLPEARPAYGVYLVEVSFPEKKESVYGVANYGLRPTVEEEEVEPLFEVHLLGEGDYSGYQPRDLISGNLLSFIRPEKKFDSIEDLKSQIVATKPRPRNSTTLALSFRVSCTWVVWLPESYAGVVVQNEHGEAVHTFQLSCVQGSVVDFPGNQCGRHWRTPPSFMRAYTLAWKGLGGLVLGYPDPSVALGHFHLQAVCVVLDLRTSGFDLDHGVFIDNLRAGRIRDFRRRAT